VFRQLIQAAPGATVINATEGGLGIDGVPNQPLVEVLRDLDLPHQERPRPLRELLAERAATYHPQTDWPRFWSGWEALRQGAAELAASAAGVLSAAAGLPAPELSLVEAQAIADPEAIQQALAHPLTPVTCPASFSTFHEPQPVVADPGEGRRCPCPPDGDVWLVHRRIRHGRSPSGQDMARRVSGSTEKLVEEPVTRTPPGRRAGCEREICCAAGPVRHTLRNQTPSNPSPATRFTSASGMSSSVAARPSDRDSSVSQTRVVT
jgi:hypothetical protein